MSTSVTERCCGKESFFFFAEQQNELGKELCRKQTVDFTGWSITYDKNTQAFISAQKIGESDAIKHS